MRQWQRTAGALATALIAAVAMGTAGLANAADTTIKCRMEFSMAGWSAFYKKYAGKGIVKCSNGESRNVSLTSEGGGLTVGKSRIDNGIGEFSAVASIDEIMGSYASAEAHAGAVKSAQGEVLTKGEVSLALSGTGRGWDLGIAFGKFTIIPN